MLTTERFNETSRLRSHVNGFAPQELMQTARSYGISDTWQLIRRYKRFLAGFVICGALLSFVALMSLTEIYTATSAIVFDRNDTRP